MKKILKPKEDCKVRHPETGKHLEAEGQEVDMNKYWQRRLDAGDVVEVSQGKTSSVDSKSKYKSSPKVEDKKEVSK